MLCENCGENHANVRYTKIVNGVKQEYFLCENCSKKLGIGNMDFTMPINFSSFFSDFLGEFENESILPKLETIKMLKCDNCNLTFDEFINTGKIGCSNCYDTFQEKIDPILKNIQGSNRHIGRLGKINNSKTEKKKTEKQAKPKDKLSIKKAELTKAVEEERYEDAAKIRDEIKKLEENK